MLNLTALKYPIVQLSLDLTSLDEAIETAAVASASSSVVRSSESWTLGEPSSRGAATGGHSRVGRRY